MPVTSDIDLQEIKSAIEANSQAIVDLGINVWKAIEANTQAIEANAKAIADLTQEVRVGFARMDTKIVELRGDLTNKLTEIKGEIALLRQPAEFWEFVKRGMAVTVFGGLLLTFGKFIISGRIV
jgi:hypothetical protein